MNLYLRWTHEIRENERQQAAFQRTDNTVVIAGPGSGKTRVLALKVAQLLREVIAPPQGIACITYTRMMAHELEERLRSLGILERPNVFVGTVHGFSLGEVVLPFQRVFDTGLPEAIRVASRAVQDTCFNTAMREVFGDNYDPDNNWKIKERFNKYRRQRADRPLDQWEDYQDFGRSIERYEQCLTNLEYIDFDMIIHAALRLILDHDIVRKSLHARFPWFAVDEYQDLGYPLCRIVTEMVDQTPTQLFAIGDPDQSIFDFAGTDPKYLRELSQRPDMQPVIHLETNYRSRQEIIEVGQTLLGGDRTNRSNETGGQCRIIECRGGIHQQAEVAIALIEQYQRLEIPTDEIAVLHKWRSAGIEVISEVFADNNIDFTLDKHPLYDRNLELIHWLEDMGYWCLKGWREQTSGRYNLDSLLSVWQEIGYSPGLGFDEDTNSARIHLTKVLWGLRNPDQMLNTWLDQIIESLDLESSLQEYGDTHPDGVEELQRLRQLVTHNNELEDLTLQRFVNLNPSVQLTTLHSSKGAEFRVVIMIGIECVWESTVNDRLMYVGATRAKDVLCLLYTKTRAYRSRYSATPHYITLLKTRAIQKDWQFIRSERY